MKTALNGLEPGDRYSLRRWPSPHTVVSASFTAAAAAVHTTAILAMHTTTTHPGIAI